MKRTAAIIASLLLASSAHAITVTTVADSGPGSLRQAITDANAAPGSTITFAQSNLTRSICPVTPFPYVVAPVTIDALSSPGGRIEITGACLNVADNILRVMSPNVVLRGLVINDSPIYGVIIDGPDGTGVRIESSYFGVDLTGTKCRPNARSNIIVFNAGGVVIDGVLSSCSIRNGINISGAVFGLAPWWQGAGLARDNWIINSIVGMDRHGRNCLPNGKRGILLRKSQQTTVMNSTISCNDGDGVTILGKAGETNPDLIPSGNRFWGNCIGLDINCEDARPNLGHGIAVHHGTETRVGGGTSAKANKINSNTGYGYTGRGDGWNTHTTTANNNLMNNTRGQNYFAP